MTANMLPAILIGGPPHAGKSVLFYSLTRALHLRGIPHHAIRACPDGEGNWSQEINPALAQHIRLKGEWTTEFALHVSRDISQRLLPLLVDMGGRPQGEQIAILQQCTHSILLLHDDDETSKASWSALTQTCGLLPLARLSSQLLGTSHITAERPVITGTITGLDRNSLAQGPVFDLLLARVCELFTSFTEQELERLHLERAPGDLVISLPQLLHTLQAGARDWTPALLPTVLAYLPSDTTLSAYGRAPMWLYAAIAAHTYPHPFYQFDPRLRPIDASPGWVQPPQITTSDRVHPEIEITSQSGDESVTVSLNIKKKHLDYLHAHEITIPEVPPAYGVTLNGAMPAWLLVAIVRAYQQMGIAWIACYQPKLDGSIVIYSQHAAYHIGSVIPTQ